jgi:hypothetical protein
LSAAAAAGWIKGLLRGLAAHAKSGWPVRMICPPIARSGRECGTLLDCSGNRAAGAELEAIGEVRER